MKKLKKKPFGLIESTEQLEIEVKVAQTILDNLEQATATAKDNLDKLDPAKLQRAATSLARNAGYKIDASEPSPSFDEIKVAVLGRLRLVALAMLTAALGSFIDPLESVTRYPDSPHAPFDENNPYIKNFMGLHDVITCILQKSEFSRNEMTTFPNQSVHNARALTILITRKRERERFMLKSTYRVIVPSFRFPRRKKRVKERSSTRLFSDAGVLIS